VAELADDLGPSALEAGLVAVQQRHPLLTVHVEDHPRTRLGFYRTAAVPPIPVTVLDAGTGRTWRDVVAEELTRSFDTARAPMVRVVLRAGHTTPAAIVLTCTHTIVDGLSAGYILRDLFSALNGHPLQALPIPPSQEELIGRLRDAQPPAVLAAASQQPPAQPPWLNTPSTIRPFDGAVPHLSAISFDQDLTRRLVTRAHALVPTQPRDTLPSVAIQETVGAAAGSEDPTLGSKGTGRPVHSPARPRCFQPQGFAYRHRPSGRFAGRGVSPGYETVTCSLVKPRRILCSARSLSPSSKRRTRRASAVNRDVISSRARY